MISIEKIAKEANVSSMTVSRVLDPRRVDKVKASTREKVLTVCRKHDYSPRYSARSLASGKTFTVGVILNDYTSGLSSPTLSLVLDSIIKELEKHSYSLNMIYCPGENLDEINEKLLGIVYSRRVDGFLFFGEMLTQNSIEKLKKTSIPTVICSMPSSRTLQEHLSYVYSDNQPATRDAIVHLKNIGINKLACVDIVSAVNSCVERMGLFHKEAEKAGLFAKNIICDYKYRHLQAIHNSFEWVLENWKTLDEYDAYVFSNDLMAIGGVKAIESKGLVPGRDKVVVGFDNIEENVNYFTDEPVITTIAPPHVDLGKEAVKLLIEQITSNERKVVRLALPSKLIIRRSSRRD